jgi:phenylacetate-coenzyme A ligase PaaK-like adenylate-forming protein
MISPVNKWTGDRTGLHENLNPETLLAWQTEKLNQLIYYARKNTKFYSDILRDECQLKDLPFTFPSDLAADPLAFLAVPQGEVVRVTTLANSGTTHLRKRIFFTQADLERTKDFFAWGMSTMVAKGDHAQILISNKTENSLGSLLSESLSRLGVTSEITAAIKSVRDAIDASRGADCLIGMPVELLYMSRTAPELRPASVLLAADLVPQSVINGIMENWKCQVFSHYGHTEFGYGCAVDCGYHSGYHLRHADLIFEIIDTNTGLTALPGEPGEIVITTLSNEAMPLIRYRTGNLSCLVNTPCPCGCSLPRLGKIVGRRADNISIVNGKTISMFQLDELLLAHASVRSFDAILQGKTLHLTIDSGKGLDQSYIIDKLPQELNIKFHYGDADPFANRGKRRLQMM